MERRCPQTSSLAIVALCCVLVADAAYAHGIPPRLAHAILGFFVLVAVVPVIVDNAVFKRWAFTARPGRAAIVGHLAAMLVAIPVFQALQSLGSALAYALEPSSIASSRWLRTYSWTLELFITALAMVVMKALVLKWCFAWPLTPRAFGALLLSTVGTVAGTAALAVLYVFATR